VLGRWRTGLHHLGEIWRSDSGDGLGLHPGASTGDPRPFLFDLVQQELIDRYGSTPSARRLKAYTTIDPDLQAKAEAAVATCSEVASATSEGGPASGLASVDPSTARSSPSPSTEGYAQRKPVQLTPGRRTASPALLQGLRLTPRSKQGIDPNSTYYSGTSPMTLSLPGGGSWTVNNDEPGGGTMSLAEATWNRSTSSSPARPRRRLRKCHPYGPSDGDRSSTESVPAEAIAVSALGLRRWKWPMLTRPWPTAASTTPTAISRVEFPNGKVDEAGTESGERVLTEGEAYDVTELLEGVITQGTGAGYTYMGCLGGG